MSLQQAIKHWDGRSSEDISAIYEEHKHSDQFIHQLLQLSKRQAWQTGASWLLKHSLEDGIELGGEEIAQMVESFTPELNWQARLHLLQSLPYLSIDSFPKSRLEAFLRRSLSEQNKFVRAWAYNGFYLLAVQYPEHREEVKHFFDLAMRDEPASVKARIRNIIKADALGLWAKL